MGEKINEYANEAFTINDEDFYDVDFWTGLVWSTHKISGASIKLAMKNHLFQGTAFDYMDGQGTAQPFPSLQNVTIQENISNGIVTTASLLTYVPHYTIIPPAGTYLVLIQYEARNSAPNQLVYGAIFKNAVNEFSMRNFHQTINNLHTNSLQKALIFDGIDTLSLSIAMSGGSVTTENKSIVLIKIA